jgi:hypothetical protein
VGVNVGFSLEGSEGGGTGKLRVQRRRFRGVTWLVLGVE